MATGFKLSFSFLLPQWENVNSETEAKLFEGRFQVVGILPGEETPVCSGKEGIPFGEVAFFSLIDTSEVRQDTDIKIDRRTSGVGQLL